jgi:uncharacterized protein YdeI (YjbR/CyaY-like superfamily)
MQPSGLAAVAAARANGTWTALDAVETLAEPPDLDAAPGARRHWDAFPRSARRAILEWITNARTGPTRQARIQRTADDAARNIRANQWKQPKAHASDTARQTPSPRD